jgi:putative ABC transport system permease protein
MQGMLTAICLGLIGGAYPAWAAANLTPVEALRYEGGSSGEVTGRLARVGSQSFRNLWRRKTRTIITATGIGVGVATIVMLGSLTKGFMGELNNLAGSGGTGSITVAQRDTADLSLSTLDERMIGQIRGMAGVESVSPLILGFVSTADFPLFVLSGIDPNSAAMNHYALVAGRRVQRPNEIILGKAASKNYKTEIGDTITLYNSRYKVVGIFETGVAWEEGGGLVALREAQRLLNRPRAVSFIFVDVAQADQADAVAAAINQRFSEARASLSSDFAQNTRDMQSTEAIAQAIGLLAIFVGGVVVANTMIMAIYERTREIGTLRAVGWRKRRILSQVLQETFFLCLLAGILGTVLGILFIWGLAAIPGVDSFLKPSLDPASIVQGIVLAVAIGLIGSFYPAWRASRMQPVEALRYE